MRTLLVTILALVVTLFLVRALVPYARIDTDFQHILDVKIEQQKRVPSPRILVIGGSNVLFGFDSKMMQDSLHIPVYNMGSTAWVGLPNMLSVVEQVARPGDIVLYSFEYDSRETDPTHRAILNINSPHADIKSHLTFEGALVYYHSLAQFVLDNLLEKYVLHNVTVDSVYTPGGANAQGDLISHLNRKTKFKFNVSSTAPIPTLANMIPLMKAHLAYDQSHSIYALYFPPSISESYATYYRPMVDSVYRDVGRAGFTIACPKEEMIFADSLCYDTDFHLNAAGRRKRTQRMIHRLRPYLPEIKSSLGR